MPCATAVAVAQLPPLPPAGPPAAPATPATVLDPFSGAGSSGVAALKLGRSYIGLELNADYVAIAEKRLRQIDTYQPRLL
mgnify:CR=1 FL=1